MEGPKRLEFTTLGPPGKQEKKDATPKTHRFSLDIPESNDTTCPEFFYTELLKTIPGAEDKPKASLDPFDDDDADKLAAIAKSFEDKYNKPGTGKKKKKKWQDNYYLEQLGEGYDENDTFIDNSEAYDEVLPETMTTKLGGFYINSGRLELKEMSDSSEDEFRSPLPVKKNKKRRISSEEDSDGEKVVKKKKIKDSLSVDGEVKKKKKKKLIIPPGEKPVKKVKMKDKVKDGKSNAVSALIKTTSPNLNGEGVENGVLSSDSDDNDEAKIQMKSNISMVIDSVIAMAANDSNSRGDFEESMPKKDIDLESIPKLPPGLPAGMDDKIEQLKNHALESRDGKCKFFTEEVNKQLLEVEMASKQMSVGNRSAMFGHLAAFLPCSKETLLKRAKTLRVKELEDKIKEPLDKLKEAVNRIMPALIEKFEEDSKKAALEKLEEGNKEAVKEDKEKEGGKEDAATESDEEEKTNQSDTTKKRQTGPRKKFVWDSEVRSLLCDVVRVKMHTYMMSKGKSQTAEEFCKNFLEQDVRPIWPKGWMQTRVLYKESRVAHSLWTNPQKAKKPLLVSKAQAATATNQISKSPNIPVTSTPSSAKMPYVTVTKINSGNTVVKTTSVNINNAKPATSSLPNTPSVVAKKIVPTILDYANSNTGSGSISSSNLSLLNSSLQGSAEKPSPSVIKISDMRLPGAKKTDSSWDHMVSDILRSSMGSDQPSRQSPPKPVVQRQNSNSTPQAASGYMAQFAKYVNSQDTAMPTGPAQLSPDKKLAETQMLLNEQRKKLAQQQKMHIEAEKQRQIKLLNAQKLELEEKEKQYTQKIAMQLASAQNAAFMQKQRPKSEEQPKIPSQSPMSLAMSKNIPVGQGQSGSRKQLVGQFKPGNGQHLSDNLIRQQLNENSKGSPMLQQVKTVQKQPSGSFMQVSPTSDSLRKTSPQSQTLKIQGKSGSQHIVTLHNSQSQGQVLFSPGVTVTTNSRPASSLLKTLFGQAQAQTSSQSFPVPNIQRSSVQGTPSPKVTSAHGQQPQHRWSPNASSIQELQARLQNAAGMQPKPYARPVTSPQAVPGYQSVKLSSLTPEQLQSYQVQQLRSPTFNKQMSAPDGSK